MNEVENTRKDGGRGRGRGKMPRQSRRTRGLQPDKQKPLEEIEKEARDRRAVAREEKKAERVEGRSNSARLGGGNLGRVRSGEPEQASVGGAVKVESPAVDGTLESSRLGHDVVEVDDLEEKTTPGETPTIKLEGPLSTVQEEPGLDVLGDDLQSSLETSVSSSSCVQVPNEVSTSRMKILSSAQETVDLTAVDDSEASENPVVPNLVKLYVDDQVRRWEQVSLEFVMSPMIEYAWPHPAPNFQVWYGTVMATSEYLASRMSSGTRAQTWISEWRLVKLAPNIATDLTSVTVPLNELSMRECAAVLQTIFFEVGFFHPSCHLTTETNHFQLS
ncbi:hypothetical protein PHMEG_00021540 [Phytophthora megakarya]|uniref:Uncharacterized protein n=1 Tax=Phytophthora megakarya TaxID=4795 RepID=A0A225VL09_9STRA|nr:hypothetical protein PHMEG_00021540 [Phytophthora megakarya]